MRCASVGVGSRKACGDRLGRQAADLAQRQRDARFLGQARVAAGEDQPQAVVLDRRARPRSSQPGASSAARFGLLAGLVPADQAAVAADPVDRLEAAGRDQPGAPGWPARRRAASARRRPGRRRAAPPRPGSKLPSSRTRVENTLRLSCRYRRATSVVHGARLNHRDGARGARSGWSLTDAVWHATRAPARRRRARRRPHLPRAGSCRPSRRRPAGPETVLKPHQANTSQPAASASSTHGAMRITSRPAPMLVVGPHRSVPDRGTCAPLSPRPRPPRTPGTVVEVE